MERRAIAIQGTVQGVGFRPFVYGIASDLRLGGFVRNEMGGYSIVQADSHEAATKMFDKDFPHLKMPGAWIEVVEIMQIPGM